MTTTGDLCIDCGTRPRCKHSRRCHACKKRRSHTLQQVTEERVCGLDGCTNTFTWSTRTPTKFLCSPACYKEHRRRDKKAANVGTTYLSVQQRFDRKWVEDPQTGCWIWTGNKDAFGYGRLDKLPRDGGRGHWLAHRLSYELHVGPIPDGQVIRHTCHRPSCVRPSHLTPGSHQDNADDRTKAGRGRGGRKPSTPDFMHENARFDVLTIQAIRASTMSGAEIARQVGYDRSGVAKIRKRKSYGGIPDGDMTREEADAHLLDYVPRDHQPLTETERFWYRVDKTGDCWLWRGNLEPAGYGVFFALQPDGSRVSMRAHKYIYLAEVGPVPDGHHVRHLCHTTNCVRLTHLAVGTAADNTADKIAAGRTGKGRPHMRGEQHPRALLTADDVRYIRSSAASNRELATEFNVTMGIIWKARMRRTYRDVA